MNLNSIHKKFFGTNISPEMASFLGNLKWSFAGGFFVSAIMLGVNVIFGRIAGPANYGTYSLIIVLSQFLLIPITFSLDQSYIREIAKSSDKEQKTRNISSGLYFIIGNLILFSILFLLVYKKISIKFSVAEPILIMALIIAIFSGLKIITDGAIRGLQYFKYQFFGRLVETGIVVIAFIVYFFVLQHSDFTYYIYILSGGMLGLLVIYFIKLAPFLKKFHLASLKKQLSYAKILLLGTILGITFNSFDKILIAKYLNIFQLGVYSAYYTASTNLIAQATQTFVNVFFPVISGIKDGGYIAKMNRLYIILFIPIYIILSFLIFGIIKLFGQEYNLNMVYVACFGLLATLQIILTINATIITAISKDLFKKYLFWQNVINIIHIGIYGLLIMLNQISIIGIVFLFIINASIHVLIQTKLVKGHFSIIA